MSATQRVRSVARTAALACVVVLLAACGSSGGSGSGASTSTSQPGGATNTTHHGSGPVTVMYAGSLITLMEQQVKPGFDKATGYSFDGIAAGSSALATQIKGKVHKADVFISASPKVNDSLRGKANGDWVSWYATYATSPLVLGYNPKSRFAAKLKSQAWYKVITQPGIRVGRTDPGTDPKGKLTVQALDETATAKNLPALTKIANSEGTVFPEETLIGRLQSGQLDVGFFYKSEAVAAKIPTIALAGVSLRATYTVTVLNHAPNASGAQAFVAYLLGPAGRAELNRDGFDLVTPAQVTGSGVPPGLGTVLPGG